jgi:hypothetical protein
MRVVGRREAIEEQQLQAGQRAIGQEALLPGGAAPERAKLETARGRVEATVARAVRPP